uniref:Uncharacterized protein n=1 Tax=viral metagenome TaxID=1070528 RepID=A0A6H1ZMN8_9ZZZZ
MTGQNIKEMVQRSFRNVGDNELLININDALAVICATTKCFARTITGSSTGATMDIKNLVTVASQRLYVLPADVVQVHRVDLAGYKINQMNIEDSVLVGDTA